MHGIIFASLKKYTTARLGQDGWPTLLREAGLGGKIYLPTQSYADQEILSLVSAATKITGKASQELLEDFGEFIVPDLVSIYRSMIRPEWRTLDLIENVENTIHKAVRLRDKSATPPTLVVSRPSQDEVVIVYSSPRRMCGIAKGIVKGIGRHYGDQIKVAESSCMLRNDSCCRLSVKTAR